MRTLTLHTKSARIAKIINEEFTERDTTVTIIDNVAELPKQADLVLSTAATNSKDEWTAARFSCFVAIVPESLDYIRSVLDRKGALVCIGADRGKS